MSKAATGDKYENVDPIQKFDEDWNMDRREASDSDDAASFAEHLLAFPGGIEFDRDERPVRDVDL